MNLLAKVRRAAQRSYVVPSITGGGMGGFPGFNRYNWPGGGGSGTEGIDFTKIAGLRWDSSLVFAIIAFAKRNLDSVPIRTYRRTASGEAEVIPDHPVTVLLERANPWYDGGLLHGLQLWGEMAWGNSYCYKHRAPSGQLVALEYLPQGTCWPYTWPGRGEFVSEYRVGTPTGYKVVEPADILHMRYDMNPGIPLWGMSPLEACFPELAGDKLAARHEAAVLNNGGLSNLIISPKELGDDAPDDPVLELSRENAEQMEERLRQKLTGDAKMSPFVATFPVDIQNAGWTGEELNLNYTTGKAEARICACYGFHPAALGFGVGLRETNQRASLEAAIEFTVENGLLPYARRRARQLTKFLIGTALRPELGEEGEFVMYDEKLIPAVKEKMLRQLMELSGGPILTPNEARGEGGYDDVEGGDQLRNSPIPAEADQEESTNVPAQGTRKAVRPANPRAVQLNGSHR